MHGRKTYLKKGDDYTYTFNQYEARAFTAQDHNTWGNRGGWEKEMVSPSIEMAMLGCRPLFNIKCL